VRQLHAYFERMGFRAVARHRSKDVTLFRQGEVNFVVNAEPDSHGSRFAKAHGPSACAMAFRVHDAPAAYKKLVDLGAKPFTNHVGPMELNIPAIEGIGGSVIYLVDRYGDRSIYDVDFLPTDSAKGFAHEGAGLTYIDHVTHNVFRGNMDQWAGFYEKLFNFREIRYFDIEGKLTGLKSRAMTSPDGKIRIPINESSDDKSQIAEYLDLYRGEGIQHIALGTSDIYNSVETLAKSGVAFQDTPDTYYERLDNRIKGHGEDVDRLKRDRILMDGAPTEDQGLLLQIFTQNAIGPIFFEVIQRKGNEGFGEGNFKALFESIEADQVKRGVLQA
jgi:4-hydroxyphenylpyruvate dioxygenase